MMKRVLKEAWRYWKWLCVASVTSFIVLVTLTYLLGGFADKTPPPLSPSEQCLDNGGRWNADTLDCEHAA